MSTVAENKVVIFHYTLTNEQGGTIDSSEGQKPMPYLHGAGNIISGLEREMTGKKPGDTFTAVILPEDAYGKFNPEDFFQVSKHELPEGIEFQKGLQIIAEDENGRRVPVFMDGYDEETEIFTFNANHPLAGETLTFQVEVVDVQDATEAELAQGYPNER